MKFLEHNWFKLGILIILSVAVFVYWQKGKNSSVITATAIPMVATTTKTVDSTSTLKVANVAPTENLDMVLLNFKVDVQKGDTAMKSLLDTAFNSQEYLCPSIISSKDARDNLYYINVDEVASMKSKYSKYSSRIPYIKNGLNSLDKELQIVKDQCAGAGYTI